MLFQLIFITFSKKNNFLWKFEFFFSFLIWRIFILFRYFITFTGTSFYKILSSILFLATTKWHSRVRTSVRFGLYLDKNWPSLITLLKNKFSNFILNFVMTCFRTTILTEKSTRRSFNFSYKSSSFLPPKPAGWAEFRIIMHSPLHIDRLRFKIKIRYGCIVLGSVNLNHWERGMFKFLIFSSPIQNLLVGVFCTYSSQRTRHSCGTIDDISDQLR